MSFLFPSFLYALSALSIPIVIHLFNFRRYKKIYFSNVQFLKEAVLESRSRSMLKHWLVLLCRILAFTLIVLAFAQPFFKGKSGTSIAGGKAVSIFVDNSFSMDALTTQGSLLDEAKAKAIQITQSLNPSDKVELVSQNFDESEERWLNKDEFTTQINGLKTSADSRQLSDILKRIDDNLNHSGTPGKESFIISDFQKSFSKLSKTDTGSAISTNLIPLEGENRNNVSVDSCWFSSPLHMPGRSEEVAVKIYNYSSEPAQDVPVKLYINGEQKAIASVSVAPHSFSIANLTFIPSGKEVQQGEIHINDYPVTFDDDLFFSFRLTAHIPILWIHSNGFTEENYLPNLFGKDSLFTFREVLSEHIDYSTLPRYRLIIIEGLPSIESGMAREIKGYLQHGGSILVIPPTEKLNSASYREMLSSLNSAWFEKADTSRMKVDKLDLESPIYKTVFENKPHANIDLPVAGRHYTFSHPPAGSVSENLMRLENGDEFLEQFRYGKGSVYVLAAPLNDAYSNFQRHALFVPTMYNIALYSIAVQPLYYTLGNTQPIEAPDIELPQNTFFKINSVPIANGIGNGSAPAVSVLPERRSENNNVFLYLHNQITTAGNYVIAAGDSVISGCAFNYDRKESDMSFLSPDGLKKEYEAKGLANFSVINGSTGSFTSSLQEVSHSNNLWKYCIAVALLFLLMEEAILRTVK